MSFGCHYGEGNFISANAADDELLEDRTFYFNVIMSPFKKDARDALEKIEPLFIQMIAPSHGPLVRNPQKIITRYHALSADIPASGALVGYVSAYGYTARLAQTIAEELKTLGWDVTLQDFSIILTREGRRIDSQGQVSLSGNTHLQPRCAPPHLDGANAHGFIHGALQGGRRIRCLWLERRRPGNGA